MAIDMTPEQREVGKANFHQAIGQLAEQSAKGGVNRRDFMKGLVAAGAVVPVSAAAYYGYTHDAIKDRPIKTGLIGAGDEGGVLVGEHNPKYLQFIAYADIRPSNQKRIFENEKLKNPSSPRLGFKHHYGNDAEQTIKRYTDYKELLANPDIEAVVIALPLHLHASVAIDAMKAGKHVLCEKLMAWNIRQCKDMIKAADETGRILTIGHQRHYSLLYAHAVEVLHSGLLGDVKHIRALWHRNNAQPRRDDKGNAVIDKATGKVVLRDSWRPEIKAEDRAALEKDIQRHGYKSIEELVRWRLYRRTGGGLMAELGSHQLDACSIFLGKVHPLAVSGVGGKFFYDDDREVEDHVFCTFEFPGKDYWADEKHTKLKDKNDIVVVTYSSISTNAFEPYGECVMGHNGTMVVDSEQQVMLWPERGSASASRLTTVSVTSTGGKPALDSSSSPSGPSPVAASAGQAALGHGPVSRGYREEMEHFAYCVRMHQQAKSEEEHRKWQLEPRCHGRVAMADAIIALTANRAMREQKRIVFDEKWFDAATAEVPDGEQPA